MPQHGHAEGATPPRLATVGTHPGASGSPPQDDTEHSGKKPGAEALGQQGSDVIRPQRAMRTNRADIEAAHAASRQDAEDRQVWADAVLAVARFG
ncbi:hypothetical protein BGC_09910 [Burkholderia sp. 3C]